ncbi:hypothetical protein CWB99_22310 [Pseudoalteromonas rubra]|uniref:Uncharacterized protein n=1 Tax=Pseudoalteromonas rubra TaxID=43658 RepID=A0A5S3WFW8_9GAMM|nr:hypothetical protein [Pseudoalteromonas rubra]TMP24477.1 hypothetical protein CWB99_22310 [Pseudoalteromonas rubra]TMP33282.1 hypothetical protein CWC00_10930 [Pseudoalteromonas rubra]
MLMYKSAASGYLPAQSNVENGNKLPESGNNDSGFTQQLALEMPMYQTSDISLQYQRKELQTTIRNESFLGEMQEAMLMQRLGVDIEKIKQLKEKLEELEDLFESGGISEKEFNQKASKIEEMIAEEYQKGQERAQEHEQREGILVTKFKKDASKDIE